MIPRPNPRTRKRSSPPLLLRRIRRLCWDTKRRRREKGPHGVDRRGRSSSAVPRRAPQPAAHHRPTAKSALAPTQLAAAAVASYPAIMLAGRWRRRGGNPHGVNSRGWGTRARPSRRVRQPAAHPPRPDLGLKKIGAGANACSSSRPAARATPPARQKFTHDVASEEQPQRATVPHGAGDGVGSLAI